MTRTCRAAEVCTLCLPDVHLRRLASRRMSTEKNPAQRADAIFEALNASEAEEDAKEAAAVEEKAERLDRIREQVETRD